ncbi:MAG: oxygen-dependent coproporphyrinogen oxidase [Bacteroidia bacterium]
MIDKKEVADWMKTLQDEICAGLENADAKAKFKEDKWERSGGGGGITRVIESGNVIEKGGVNYSAVHGDLDEKVRRTLNIEADNFFATGISIVIHPVNPFVPTIHMNTRYFEVDEKTNWFGGGIDLTPVYVNKEETTAFHDQLKKTCDKFDINYYPNFKRWADEYFFIPHRNETRGVGGIFYDRLTAESNKSIDDIFSFTKAVGKTFLEVYLPLIANNEDKTFGDSEKNWQLLRRGRYAEFNLVYDKGTKFGLETQGRTESILMSLPPLVKWEYDYQPEPGSREEETLNYLKKS